MVVVSQLRKEYRIGVPAAQRGRQVWSRLHGSDSRPPDNQRGRDRDRIVAVDGVSFVVRAGESIGVTGESGCGKSTLGKCLAHLVSPTSGSVRFGAHEIGRLRGRSLKEFRRSVQMVFQDPAASLDPRWKVRDLVAEPLRVHRLLKASGGDRQLAELIDLVGLRPDHLDRVAHELSGGEQQRVSIARAIATRPSLLILDEPTSALDASTRIHIVKLLNELQRKLNMTYVLISHDLSVIRGLCDRVLVMYLGRVVEEAPVKSLFQVPLHPYTQALLAAIPVPDPDILRQPVRLRGDLTTIPVEGCNLAPRCPSATAACATREQHLVPWSEGHYVACHRTSEGEIRPIPVLVGGHARQAPFANKSATGRNS
jgi:oligopeptide/dipeptide ABC transporter ATP-binding protein